MKKFTNRLAIGLSVLIMLSIFAPSAFAQNFPDVQSTHWVNVLNKNYAMDYTTSGYDVPDNY